MTSLFSSTLDSVRSLAGSIAWKPLVNVSRSGVLSLIQQIEVGKLTIHESDGTETRCGEVEVKDSSRPVTELKVLREAFWVRVALFADMVFFRQPSSSTKWW